MLKEKSGSQGLFFSFRKEETIAGIKLFDYQRSAVERMKNGCILCGGVGSGKSRTALAYYYLLQGGKIDDKKYIPMKRPPTDLYIITTARKRDTSEWEIEMEPFQMSSLPILNEYTNNIVIDSWNNIRKYVGIEDAFFIFDEQRVVGSGVWAKSFLKIAENNQWILLSATPGDTWSDYIPVFIANGFYRNRSEFTREHIIYSHFTKFPKITQYVNTKRLERQRDDLLINMDFKRKTVAHHKVVLVQYDMVLYKYIMKNRWNVWEEKPLENAGELCYALRKVANTDNSRKEAVLEIVEHHKKAILFYNFNYELEILKNLSYPVGTQIAEWNGQKHEPLPEGDAWVYLVQYTAGC